VREKYCWPVADKPSAQGVCCWRCSVNRKTARHKLILLSTCRQMLGASEFHQAYQPVDRFGCKSKILVRNKPNKIFRTLSRFSLRIVWFVSCSHWRGSLLMLRHVIRVDKLHMCAVFAVCLCRCGPDWLKAKAVKPKFWSF
jgi:hypothetical protein